MDTLKQEYNKARYELYKDSHQKAMKKWRDKQLIKQVGEDEQCCTRCYKIQPKSEYGEYKGMAKIEGKLQETMIPYRSCNACRNRDKQSRSK